MKRLFGSKTTTTVSTPPVPSPSNPTSIARIEQPIRRSTTIPPPRAQDISAVIGYSCASSIISTSLLYALADYIRKSESKCKETVRAVRKEIKYGSPAAQYRAFTILGVLGRNLDDAVGDGFRKEVASKRFLKEIDDCLSNANVDSFVRDVAFRILSDLAYSFQSTPTLLPLTTLFNKLKPAGAQWPTNGAPLQDDDPLLEPTIGKGPLNPDGTPSDADTDQYRYQPDGRSRRRDNLPTTEDQLVELKHHVEQAREMTVLLVEAIEFTEASEVENDPIIREFYNKVVDSQQIIVSNLPWISAQADNSRPPPSITSTAPPIATLEQRSKSPQLSSNNPFAAAIAHEVAPVVPVPSTPAPTTAVDEAETEEEKILASTLMANQEIINALELYSDRVDFSNRTAELLRVQEQSLSSRDDSVPAQVPAPPSLLTLAGGSSSITSIPTPSVADTEEVANAATERQLSRDALNKSLYTGNPYAAYLVPAAASSKSSSTSVPSIKTNNYLPQLVMDPPTPTKESGRRGEGGIEEDRDEVGEIGNTTTGAEARGGEAGGDLMGFDDEDEDELKRVSNSGPSEKALGKLRKLSIYSDDANPDERQMELEKRLRDKYVKNLADEEARKSSVTKE